MSADTPLLNEEELLKLKYQKKTQYEHIIDLPDTYIGSIIAEQVDQYIIGQKPDSPLAVGIIKEKMNYVPGLFKIFDEIIVNANDNRNRIDAKLANGEKNLAKMTTLKVNIFRYKDDLQPEKWAIQVYNDGEGIDVAKHPVENIWIPQMIFAELLTSGNYNKSEQKVTGGKNGYGAKLTNIFSTYFKIETIDRNRHLKYSQVYRNNMLVKEEPIIEKITGKQSYTSITFVPDYARFGGMDDLSPEMIALFKKRTYDMVFTSQNHLNIWFNDVQLQMTSCLDYIKLYLPETVAGHELVHTAPHVRWYIAACMSPNFQFGQVSFVNGICTLRGGRHVDYVVKQITSKLAAWILKKRKVEVRESFIKDNLMVFVNALIVNPSFDSQTKETLTTNMKDFGSKFELDDKFIEHIAETGIVDRALAQTQFQESQILKKTDGKKNRRILDIEKLEDAELAGTKNSHLCTLILTEGDSAKAMAVAGISAITDGRQYYGIFPLKGKLLNTRDVKEIELVNNTEITNIKRILGLQEGETYTDVNKLRYGRIMSLCDSDVDGSHIKGLVINYISSHFPSLLKLPGFITSMLTPIVKVWRGKHKDKAMSFYNLPDYNRWAEANDNGRGWNIKYYKGLGTSTPEEAKQYFKDFQLVVYHWDDDSNESIDMAFNKERADDRKTWMLGYDGQVLNLGQSRITFTDFINKDLILFSIASVSRAIPHLMDGLKPSLRKIMYCCFKRNLTSEIKVAQLAGYVSEHGAYHHGEASLHGAIINMAQNFPGSNNINMLVPEGQFGSRLQGGSDFAAPRYIFTYLSAITNKIYKKEDEPLLKYIQDDGEVVEPEHYAPVIPMLLVNGADGIGTGWSSKLPQFNPIDLVNVIRGKILGGPTPELVPWYRGFKGTIFEIGRNSWMTRGKYRVIDSKTVEITELPIGTWTHNYKTMLDKMVFGPDAGTITSGGAPKKKSPKRVGMPPATPRRKITAGIDNELVIDENAKILKDYKNECTEIEVKFTLVFDSQILNALLSNPDSNGINDFERRFKLVSRISCNRSMNFFGADGKLMNMESIQQIIDLFYDTRLVLYERRRMYMINEMEHQLAMISVKVRFILEIIEGTLKINNVPRIVIEEKLREGNYPLLGGGRLYKPDEPGVVGASYNYLVGLPIYTLTKEKIEELVAEKDQTEAQLASLREKKAGDLWLTDLDEFVEEYDRFTKAYYKYYGLNEDDFKQGGRPAPKINLSGLFAKKV